MRGVDLLHGVGEQADLLVGAVHVEHACYGVERLDCLAVAPQVLALAPHGVPQRDGLVPDALLIGEEPEHVLDVLCCILEVFLTVDDARKQVGGVGACGKNGLDGRDAALHVLAAGIGAA